jgi:hypothetical protein
MARSSRQIRMLRIGHVEARMADVEAILRCVKVTCGAEVRAAALAGVLLAAMSGCSGTAEPDRNASGNGQQATPANSEMDQPQALLAPGDAPTFERFDDAQYKAVAGVSPEGCVSVTLEDGRTLLLFAPYGSHLSAESPRIRGRSSRTLRLGARRLEGGGHECAN